MTRYGTLGLAALMLFAGAPASAQLLGEKNEIYVQLDVGYNTAYREATWVPVDVTVNNQQAEVDGWIEVRTFDFAGNPQSPVYRVPAVCPKDSTKRFRLTCFLEDVDRVEAWLIEDGRAAVDVPAFLRPRPIETDDILALVLDDDDVNFGFLFNSVQAPGRQVRLHRHGVKTSDLNSLPRYPEAFEAFDVVVMGEIDPGRVSAKHRELIERYVRDGGMLVVTLGSNTGAYRGSWVEALLDTELGAIETMREPDLAARVFAPDQRAGLREDRECVVTRIHPKSEGTRTFGQEQTIATLRPLGRGHVATMALDAAGHALQSCTGYRDLWAQLIAGNTRNDTELRVDLVAGVAAQQLPALSGVSIRSRASVLTYLGLYIGVGVVGNWLFWNWRKRREMAWLCLMIFSVAFTAYAVIYGTAGWAKATELQQIEIVDLPLDGDSARYHALTGILTARSTSFSGALNGDGLLLSDPDLLDFTNSYTGYGVQYDDTPRTPFRFVQGSTPKLEELRIGASELRFLHIQGRTELEGGIEGSLTLDEDSLRGELRNRTGLALGGASLLIDGYVIDLEGGPDTWTVDLERSTESRGSSRPWLSEFDTQQEHFSYYYYPSYGVSDMTAFKNGLKRVLFSEDDMSLISSDHAPRLLAWADAPLQHALRADGELISKSIASLIACEVDVARNARLRLPLALHLNGGQWQRPTGETPGAIWNNASAENFYGTNRSELTVAVTDAMLRDPDSELFVTVYWNHGTEEQVFILPKIDVSDDWQKKHWRIAPRKTTSDRLTFNITEYALPDWRMYTDPRNPKHVLLSVAAESKEVEQGKPGSRIQSQFRVSARGLATVRSNLTGDWPGWR